MICPRCSNDLSGDTALIGEPMLAANGYPDDYILLVSCPCGATLSIRIWQSEESAIEDAELESERDAAGITGLLDDTAGVSSSDRDHRNHDLEGVA